MEKNTGYTKRIARLGVLAAFATAIHAIEGLLPPLIAGVPIKLGLANVLTLYTLIRFSPLDALMVTVIRCVLGSLIAGSTVGLLFSLAGGLLAWCAMSALIKPYKLNKVSEIGVSITGAWFFNIGQLVVGFFLYGKAMLYYFPILELSGVATGMLTGFITYMLINHVLTSNHLDI